MYAFSKNIKNYLEGNFQYSSKLECILDYCIVIRKCL